MSKGFYYTLSGLHLRRKQFAFFVRWFFRKTNMKFKIERIWPKFHCGHQAALRWQVTKPCADVHQTLIYFSIVWTYCQQLHARTHTHTRTHDYIWMHRHRHRHKHRHRHRHRLHTHEDEPPSPTPLPFHSSPSHIHTHTSEFMLYPEELKSLK